MKIVNAVTKSKMKNYLITPLRPSAPPPRSLRFFFIKKAEATVQD